MPQRMIDFFMEIVRIDSESGNEAELLNHLEKRFTEELDAECLRDDYGNLIARIQAKESTAPTPILLCSHADTVKPGLGIEPVLEAGVIRSAGDTVLGADDKAGIAEIFEAILSAESHPPLEIAITREEEIGLVGAKNLDISKLSSKMGFLFDADRVDAVIVGGPSHMLIDAEFIGKAAHAGMEPENGINAIQAASFAISKLKLGRLDAETTANVGIIKGGSIRNGVPDRCTVIAECRSLDDSRCEDVAKTMLDALRKGASEAGATVEINSNMAYRACRLDDDSPVVKIVKTALTDAGFEPETQIICGGTDASILNARGIPTAVVGIGVKKEHTIEEEVAVEDMEAVVEIIHGIFRQFP